jgi:hypothetical protein
MNEYLKLQHMELVANIPDDHFSYLSYHAVIKAMSLDPFLPSFYCISNQNYGDTV